MISQLTALRDKLTVTIKFLASLTAAGVLVAPQGRGEERAGTIIIAPNGTVPPGEAAAGEGMAICAQPGCGQQFLPRTSGAVQRYCSRACRQAATSAARRKRAVKPGVQAKPEPDTSTLPDQIERPFRSQTRYRSDPPEAVAERERHLALPAI